MIFWNYIVICLSVILLVLLLVWEIQRPKRARLQGRVIATVLLVAALAAIALPLGYTSRPAAGSKEGILLTEGYDPDSLRIYINTTGKKDAAIWRATGQGFQGAGDISEASVLHLFGFGLTEEQRAALPNIPLIFHPSVLQTGIVSLHWRRQLLPGEVCRIQGSFYHATPAPVKLLLFGLNTLLDSAEIKSREEGDFELRTVPAQAGRAVYKLIAVAGTDTLEQESIPVETLPGKNLKILFLAAAPDFENRFLAGWLSEKGHGVVVRTAISKDKYDDAYLNMPAMVVDHLSPSLLSKFDVVIADAAELKAMPAADHACLWREIAEKGLGLVTKADSTSLGRGGRVRIAVGGDSSVLRMVIADEPGQLPLLRDSLARTLVNIGMHGSGKVALTTLNNSFTRLLAGDKKEYAGLWTRILQQTAREGDPLERWQFAPALAAVDHPVKISLQYAGSSLPQGLLEGEHTAEAPVSIYLAQHPLLPFRWEGLYWPREPGWHSARTPQGEPGWWFVWKDGDWKNLYRRERMQGTARWIATRGEKKVPEGGGAETETRETLIAKGWFYLCLVLSSLFLWVERKI